MHIEQHPSKWHVSEFFLDKARIFTTQTGTLYADVSGEAIFSSRGINPASRTRRCHKPPPANPAPHFSSALRRNTMTSPYYFPEAEMSQTKESEFSIYRRCRRMEFCQTPLPERLSAPVSLDLLIQGRIAFSSSISSWLQLVLMIGALTFLLFEETSQQIIMGGKKKG